MAQSPKLCRIDIKILTALHEDVMITNAALSGLSRLSRVRAFSGSNAWKSRD